MTRKEWHALLVEETAARLGTDLSAGFGPERAARRLKEEGPNELKEQKGPTLLQKLLAQLSDFLVVILILSAVVSAVLKEVTDAVVIISIVILNAVLGVIQEAKAEKALEGLKKMASPIARVIRNGHVVEVPARDLVRGDVVLLEAGANVPADLRLVEAVNLKAEEAALTGESVPVEKRASVVLDENTALGDRTNMVFMGTAITYGRGRGIVVETGMSTQIGKIAGMIQSYSEEKTHLQEKLEHLGKRLGLAVLAITAIVFAVGLLRAEPLLEMFMTAVSLAVAAIPEGLPAVVTIVLAMGMRRMASRNAIIRRLSAVETLGAATVICSDKTGTLTQNQMVVVRLWSDGREVKVSGEGYRPEGEFTEAGTQVYPNNDPQFRPLLQGAGLNGDAVMDQDEAGHWKIIGDPTEGALLVVATKAGLSRSEVEKELPRVGEIPFDSQRKRMTTIHARPGGGFVAIVKGAPDLVIDRCTHYLSEGQAKIITPEVREQIDRANASFADDALRVLAIAQRELPENPADPKAEEIEDGLTFVGLLGMIDPARKEAIAAVAVCRQAGIKPVMITGDHKATAVAIAREIGILRGEGRALTGADLDAMDDRTLTKKVEDIDVYARVSPEHKVRIVEALRNRGHVAAMTGDGVNDALALKRADIGVAMGITGTDVAKGTSDMILADDNFATIVSAVEEGRIIYANIRKFVAYLLSANAGEILAVFAAMILGMPMPLVPIQLLWINLASDSFPALALGMEKGDPDVMRRPPRNPKEPILDRLMRSTIVLQALAIAGATLGAFWYGLSADPGNLERARTMAFVAIVMGEIFRALSARSEHHTLAAIGLFSNRYMLGAMVLSTALLFLVVYVPFLQPVFETVSLGLAELGVVLLFSLIPLVTSELAKVFNRRQVAAPATAGD